MDAEPYESGDDAGLDLDEDDNVMALAVDIAAIGSVFDGLRVLRMRDVVDLAILRELTNRVMNERAEQRQDQAVRSWNVKVENTKVVRGG